MDDETEEYENHGEAGSSISADLIRGHINTIILRSLYDRDKYGYEIINEINQKSHGQYTLKQPTLYSALKRLETQGYIQAYWKTDEVSSGGRRKYFRLTESGKEITEKNQAEWEYSRTVIDNLISDKNFDFSQPAPTPVDFKLLKQSTSRVPTGPSGDEKVETESEPKEGQEQQPVIQVLQEPIIEAVTFTSTHETSVILQADEIPQEELPQEEKDEPVKEENAEEANSEQTKDLPSEEVSDTELNVQEKITEEPTSSETQPAENVNTSEESSESEQITQQEQAEEPQQIYTAGETAEITAAEEQRRISHEILEKLISGEFEKKPEVTENQESNEKPDNYPIYAAKPEAERDYRNLVDKIFEQTLKPPVTPTSEKTTITQPQQQYMYQQPPVQVINQPGQQTTQNSGYMNVNDKASNDGLKIQTSEGQSHSARAVRTTYNRGATLFTCSLIVGGIILLEFILCLCLKDALNISFAYPFVILALGLVDIIVCGILWGAGYGKQVRKPTSQRYIITSIIVTAILVLIIVLFAIVLSVNWSLTNDVLAKVVIPCIVALNIPVFTLSFYLLTK